ncbi:MAG: GerMN domain-containing protein [Candidatus Promineifilaceae bacterium]|nr:GerMN domain-containing protein [Candidatus Promineifilaceae bacterium]
MRHQLPFLRLIDWTTGLALLALAACATTSPTPRPETAAADQPAETTVKLYWLVDQTVEAEQRTLPADQPDLPAAALRVLLAGPPADAVAEWRTAIPTPEEVQRYPGRQPDWGDRVRLRGLTIEDGVATADFSPEMRAYGGGSARVQAIREQITRTLTQFPAIESVRIAVAGETEGVLQP